MDTLERIRALLEESVKRPPGEALAAAREGRVYLLDERLGLWLVRGRRGDYIVVRGVYCSCPWFVNRVLTGGADRLCYHIVAVELVARGLEGRPRRPSVDAKTLLLEALLDGVSRSLRRAELGLGEEGDGSVGGGAADVND